MPTPERAPDIEYDRPPNPSRRENYGGGEWFWLAGIVVVIALLACLVWSVAAGKPKDVRETRHYGDLECVYNVTLDRVEACK